MKKSGSDIELISTEVLSEEIGLSPGTLANHRTQRVGLPYIKVGRRVFYDRNDVREWLEANKIRHDE